MIFEKDFNMFFDGALTVFNIVLDCNSCYNCCRNSSAGKNNKKSQ